jgi:hypothetical protein
MLVQTDKEVAGENAREEALLGELANQATPDSLQIEAELEARRARRAQGRDKAAMLLQTIERAGRLVEVLERERDVARQDPVIALENEYRAQPAELRARAESR